MKSAVVTGYLMAWKSKKT